MTVRVNSTKGPARGPGRGIQPTEQGVREGHSSGPCLGPSSQVMGSEEEADGSGK